MPPGLLPRGQMEGGGDTKQAAVLVISLERPAPSSPPALLCSDNTGGRSQATASGRSLTAGDCDVSTSWPLDRRCHP